MLKLKKNPCEARVLAVRCWMQSTRAVLLPLGVEEIETGVDCEKFAGEVLETRGPENSSLQLSRWRELGTELIMCE